MHFGALPLIVTLVIVSLVLPCVKTFNLTVIHNNDFHARYLPIKSYNYAECYNSESKDQECIGGAARTVQLMKHFRQTTQNLLFLNAGDHFQGTIWYTKGKSEMVATFVSRMKHDVMALGNHEFDDGPEELTKFIDIMNNQMKANLTFLCCNIDIDKESPLSGMVEKSIIKVINGTKVAIIGYITPDTAFLSKPGKFIHFKDEIDAIKKEITNITSKDKEVKIFIAVGHSGFDRDVQIGEAIPELDLIVGGHTNTFLYTGKNPPSNEKPEGDYPYVIKHESGDETLIVQAFAYGKYLGKIDLTFDDNGKIQCYAGEPILINSSFAQDTETREIVDKKNEELSAIFNKTIGFTKIDLEAETCRREECILGNLISDSFAYYFGKLDTKHPMFPQCNNTLALVNGGNIRTGINKGNITFRNIISTLPFSNSLGLLAVNGSDLIELFEQSATQYRRGGFMQMSGLRATYELHGKKAKLANLEVNCNNSWNSVAVNVTYFVVISDFIANGGDNYTVNEANWNDYQLSEWELFDKYVAEKALINGTLEKRIQFTRSAASSPNILVYLVLVVLFNMCYNIF